MQKWLMGKLDRKIKRKQTKKAEKQLSEKIGLFNKIPENLRNFKLNIENEDQLKKDTEVVKLNGGYIVHKNLEDYLLFKKFIQGGFSYYIF